MTRLAGERHADLCLSPAAWQLGYPVVAARCGPAKLFGTFARGWGREEREKGREREGGRERERDSSRRRSRCVLWIPAGHLFATRFLKAVKAEGNKHDSFGVAVARCGIFNVSAIAGPS